MAVAANSTTSTITEELAEALSVMLAGKGAEGFHSFMDRQITGASRGTKNAVTSLACVVEWLAADTRTLQARIVALEAQREDQGVWEGSKAYALGAHVTYRGSSWVARTASIDRKPGTGQEWRLAVRAGRDGKDVDPAAIERMVAKAVAEALRA